MSFQNKINGRTMFYDSAKLPLFYCVLFTALLSGLLNSCASTPEGEPVVQEDSSTAGKELQKLKDLEEKAKGSIARAESAGAAELSPKLLDEAYLNLRNGQEKDPKTDGGAQREQYLAAIEKGDAAYDDSVQKSRERWLNTMKNYEDDLDELNAQLYMPEYDKRSRELLQQLRDKIAEGDNDESLALYQSTIPNVGAVVSALVADLDWLDQLRQEVTGLMGEASRQFLEGEAADLERQGLTAYDSAMGHQARGDMQSMEQDLYDARYYLRKALRLAGALDPSGIDALLHKVQKRLNEASKRKVIDSEGNEVDVEPWDGEAYLQQHPLVDLIQQQPTGERRRDESQLLQPQVSADFLQGTVPSQTGDTDSSSDKLSFSFHEALEVQDLSAEWHLSAVTQLSDAEEPVNQADSADTLDFVDSREGNPFGEEQQTAASGSGSGSESPAADEVLPEETAGDISATVESAVSEEVDGQAPPQEYVSDDGSQTGKADLLSDAQLLLKQAVSSWENGIEARNKGNLPKAKHYFEESARLLDQYEVQYAILGYYTVRRLKPEDCLWRIAGYADIYGDPYQWTRIYQRNRDQISNPSLIYPGQRLVIPPPSKR